MPGPAGPVTPPPPPRPVSPPPPSATVLCVRDRIGRDDWLALANLCPSTVIA